MAEKIIQKASDKVIGAFFYMNGFDKEGRRRR